MSAQRLNPNNLFPRVAMLYCPPRHDRYALFYDQARLLRTNSVNKDIHWIETGSHLSSHLTRVYIAFANLSAFARIANYICIISISFAPTTHFLLKLVNQKLLALHIGLQYHAQQNLHTAIPAQQDQRFKKKSLMIQCQTCTLVVLYRALDYNYLDKMHEVTKYVEFNIVLRKNV